MKLKKLLTNKKGMISYPITILCLIGVIVLTGLVDFSNQLWVLREVKGVMDMAATNTLNISIDKNVLKDEYLGMTNESNSSAYDSREESVASRTITGSALTNIRNTYAEQLNAHITTSNLIRNFNVDRLEAKIYRDNWGSGDSTKVRPYIMISAIVSVDVRLMDTTSTSINIKNGSFMNFRDGTSFQITGSETIQPGIMRLVIHTTVKAMYR